MIVFSLYVSAALECLSPAVPDPQRAANEGTVMGVLLSTSQLQWLVGGHIGEVGKLLITEVQNLPLQAPLDRKVCSRPEYPDGVPVLWQL